MQSKTDTSCLGLHSTHRSTRLAPSTTRISLPDVLRSTRRDTSKQRGERRRSIRWCGLLRRVRCIAWRREDGKARLHHQGSERGHLHHLAPAETPEKKAGEIPTGAAMGEAITGTKVASPEQREATLETTIPVECNRLTCGMKLMQTGRERPRQSGTRWRIQSVEEELLQSMQDVEDLWREKYSALEESHKVSLKTKAEMEQKIDLMTLHETELERQYRELSDSCRAQKDSLTLAHQSEQRAVAGRRDDGRTIQQLRRKVTSIRQEMAEWAGAETAKATENYKRKKEITEKMLAETLLSMEEAEEVKRQLDVHLKAAEQDAENYRECCETALEDLRLEKHTNKEATKVAMQAAHCQDQGRLTLQKQVTEIRLEAKEAQELVQSCRLEIDHMQHQIERRDRQLTAAENEIRLVQEQSAGKQEEIDALTTSLEDLRLQWDELSGGRTSRPRTMVGE